MSGHLPECLHGKCANPTRADEDEVAGGLPFGRAGQSRVEVVGCANQCQLNERPAIGVQRLRP